MVIQKAVKVSRLSGTEECCGSTSGKFEFYALPNRKPMEIFKITGITLFRLVMIGQFLAHQFLHNCHPSCSQNNHVQPRSILNSWIINNNNCEAWMLVIKWVKTLSTMTTALSSMTAMGEFIIGDRAFPVVAAHIWNTLPPARHFCTFIACLPVTPQDSSFLLFPISVPYHVQCLRSDTCHFGHANHSCYLLNLLTPGSFHEYRNAQTDAHLWAKSPPTGIQ